MSISPNDVLAALRRVQEPSLQKDLVTLNVVRDLVCAEDRVSFVLVLPTPAGAARDLILEQARDAVLAIPGVKTVDVRYTSEANRDQAQGGKNLPDGVRSIIAVASGKGGVGKSTTAVNLAVALHKQGASVGLLDADIYGPNIPMMMGIVETERPSVNPQQHLIPLEGHGIKVMSIAFLVDPGKAIIWRGPMLHGIIRQFLSSVQWGNLDYLVVDLPPGTGDAPLSLVQTVPLTGAVIVTTPQQVALSDVRRSIAMFNEVRVPILGLVENMSGLECPHCHKTIQMFEGSGGQVLSQEYDVPLLGRIPFDPAVGQSGDRGVPIVLGKPDSTQAKGFLGVADALITRIGVLAATESSPLIQIS